MPIPKINILFLSAEAHPFITVGGLGEVAYALPRALWSLPQKYQLDCELDVRLAIPFYANIRREELDIQPIASFAISHADGPISAEAFEVHVDGMPVYLIHGTPIPDQVGSIYSLDAALDASKFVFFSLAALELPRHLGWQPHVVHANDWHTAPAIYAQNLRRHKDALYEKTVNILSVHNLPYLGVGAGAALNAFGLPPATDSDLPFWAQNLPLPLGLLAADKIVTVSPTYAQEILTPEFGAGLHDFLKSRATDIIGILNGIDIENWNPETDTSIFAQYSIHKLELRKNNKGGLQRKLGLEAKSDVPLLAMIARLDGQKGVDLVMDALLNLTDHPWQAIILGTGQPELENAARRLENTLPDRVRAVIAYDKVLSRRIYAGADAILIPSRYEPCGLVQMIGMRYGCIPIARATGGLKDTIIDFDQSQESTGFLFNEATATALATAIHRALEVFANPEAWRSLQQRAMSQDFSWERSALQYSSLYTSLIEEHQIFETPESVISLATN